MAETLTYTITKNKEELRQIIALQKPNLLQHTNADTHTKEEFVTV